MALTDNLVSYWKMEDVNDAVGGRTLTNNNTVTFPSGKVNNAGSFNGSNQYLSRASDASLQITGALSIACWIYCDALNKIYISKGNGNISNYEYELSVATNGSLGFISSNGSNYFQASTTTTGIISTSTWYYVMFRKTGSTNGVDTVDFRVNGTNYSTTVGSANISNVGTSSTALQIGARTAGTASYFDGLIDEVAIWDRYLSDAEYNTLYNSGTGTTYPFGTNYPITAAQGSYALTGQTTPFVKALKMLGDYATYAYTGFDSAFARGKGFTADFGSYVVTGNDTSFSKVIRLIAEYGSYTLTGFSVVIQKGISMAIQSGQYVLTGFSVRFPLYWTNISKNISSWTNNTKNSATWDNEDKSNT